MPAKIAKNSIFAGLTKNCQTHFLGGVTKVTVESSASIDFCSGLDFDIMTKNVGKTDKIIRLIAAAGFVIISLTIPVGDLSKSIMLIVAGVFTLTAIVGTCPLYLPLGINTCKK